MTVERPEEVEKFYGDVLDGKESGRASYRLQAHEACEIVGYIDKLEGEAFDHVNDWQDQEDIIGNLQGRIRRLEAERTEVAEALIRVADYAGEHLDDETHVFIERVIYGGYSA